LKKIPIKEKVKLTAGQGNWHFFDRDVIDGRRINVADGPHGIRVYKKQRKDGELFNKSALEPATLFPCAAAMASTWNKSLIEAVGRTIGRECRYHQVDAVLGPGINLKRSPLAGRNFEYYSEDPFLTAAIATAFVRGVQSEQVGACIKHFALNEQETMRRFVDVAIDERTLHELYLYPFRKIIEHATPWMVMSSYNKINGDYASESAYLLKDILRNQWGYKGVVVSDWGAVQNKVKSIKNGMNIEMPGPSSFEDETVVALENQMLTEAELDESLAPLFAMHEKVKQVETLDSVDLDAHHAVARSVAEESIVLLENDGILPVKDTDQSIGIVGRFAKVPRINGGGSATVKPYRQEIPFEAFSAVFKNLVYADGYDEDNTTDTHIHDAIAVAKKSDIVFYFTGTTEAIETEGKDRDHMMIPSGHQRVFDAIRQHNENIVIILSNGSALDLRHLKANSRAMLETWFLGGAAGEAVVDVVLGRINPSGRLQETFPLMLENTPHYGTFPQLERVDYRQDLIMNGYRYYDTHNHDVLYPFGYGLSYGTVNYKDVSWAVNHESTDAFVRVTFVLENISDITTSETVQVYVSTHVPYLVKPAQELKGFEKVSLKPQESKTLTIVLPRDAFESYSEKAHGFVVYNGRYHVHLARHSRDIVNTKTFDITDEVRYAPPMTLEYPVTFLERFYPAWFEHIEKVFRPLRWYEREEPIWRIIDRYKRNKGIDERTIERLRKEIADAIG